MSTQGILGDFGRLFFCPKKTRLSAIQDESGAAGPHPSPLPEGEGLNCGCVQIAFAFSPLSLWERARVRVFGHKKGTTLGACLLMLPGGYQASALEASQNSVADRAMVAGKVRTQAIRMVLIVPPCRPLLFATIVPATPDDKICVVDTGSE